MLVMLHVGECCSVFSPVAFWSAAGKELTSRLSCFVVLCHVHKYVLDYIRIKGEVGAVKLVLALQ